MNKRILNSVILCLIPAMLMQAVDLKKYSKPYITNYNNAQYNASTQNWSIVQGGEHFIWFGNVGKVLWFDGVEWGEVTIPNASIVRSLYKTNSNTLFAGAYGEFGIIERDLYGQYQFVSWLEKIPEKFRDFTDIWKIHEVNNTLYIQSFQYIFVFRNGQFVRAFETQNSFRFSFVLNNRLYIEEVGVGLKILEENELVMHPSGDFFSDKQVWFMGRQNGRLLVGTKDDGLYTENQGNWVKWAEKLSETLKSHSLYCGIELKDGSYLFGTVKNGIILADKEGNITGVYNRKNGLQDNTVLSACQDFEGNIWLGLDRGIDYIRFNYQFQLINSREGFGTGYASVVHDNMLYLGTNQGVYTWSETEKDFVILQGTAGQVWTFKIINDVLYCGHDKGVFEIKGKQASLLFPVEGVWKIEKIPGSDDLFIAGTYIGFHVLSMGERFSSWPVVGFDESCRIFEFNNPEELWMSHGYKGVYRIRFNKTFTEVTEVSYFGEKQGLPKKTNNEVFKYDGKILVAGFDGFYRYNSSLGIMEPYDQWNRLIPLKHPVSKVRVDPWSRINFFNNEKITWVLFQDDTLAYYDNYSFTPLKNRMFYAFENILYLDPDRAIIGTIDGFSFYNRNKQFDKEYPVYLSLNSILSTHGKDGSSTTTPLELDGTNFRLPYNKNSVVINLSVPHFQNREFMEISYAYDQQESQIIRDGFTLLLQDLEDKTHTIELKAHDRARNLESETLVLKITILAPWYKRWYAFIGYIAIIGLIILITAVLVRRHFERMKIKEQTEQQLRMEEQQKKLQDQAEEAERQLMVIRNEQLRSQNRIKAEEIANSTMELVHKNKMLLDVKESLKIIQKERNLDVRNEAIRGILKRIELDLDNEEKWTVFEKNFDEVHENFLNRLKEKHISLTSKDLRLCAYLRMNLSSKEIAPLLRISVRSVEISRYRLRKKLELPKEESLSQYILHF